MTTPITMSGKLPTIRIDNIAKSQKFSTISIRVFIFHLRKL